MSAGRGPAADEAGPILVYDGDCAFCARSVRFILARDVRRRDVRFAARESPAGRAVRERHPAMRAVESILWVEVRGGVEHPLALSDAVLAIAEYLGGGWALLARIGRLVPRPVREAAYGIVARNRHRLTFGGDACVVFTPEQRARVLG